MLGDYEKFKKSIYSLTQIDLSSYKENQMRRRIDTLINKNKIKSYEEYVSLIKQDKEKFVVPKSVQAVIPIKTIWEDGILKMSFSLI